MKIKKIIHNVDLYVIRTRRWGRENKENKENYT